ncbi:hypothetical protein TCDM_11130 [Trypanosoma cruzi Dm28c]|uniref:Uncharacterized protein n=1 Tax=Trypanosoma cruzi Dm28c TaxID=1416333 RepID=V5D1E7_TRYCR|nr:hypothetical protein TCDM_11130 [Trypanosoma cruzi Dm28c]
MTPRAGNNCSHGGHRAAASAGLQHNAKGVPHTSIQWHRDSHRRHTRSGLAISARDASQRPAVAKSIPAEHRANTFVCVSEEQKRRGAQGGTSAQQEAQLDGSDTCGTAPTSTITHSGSTHPSNKKKAKQKKHGGRVWLCVWRCGCLPALAAKKAKQEGRNVCAAPQALVARPHVTAPSARRSPRPLLMRAAGEAHRAVVMSVSVVCGWSSWAGNTRHLSQEECSRNN